MTRERLNGSQNSEIQTKEGVTWGDLLGLTEKPSTIENKRDLNGVIFEGFSNKQESWIKKQVEGIGLPTDNIKTVTYAENSPRETTTLGSANLLIGEYRLYKSLTNPKLPERAQEGTMIHELLHMCDPFSHVHPKDFKDVYATHEDREHARRHAEAVAKQSAETHVFLNGYHKALFKSFENGDIDKERFLMETHAIMGELRFTNPKHLEQVESSQQKKLQKLGKENEFVQIMSHEGDGKPVGIDRTLVSLIKDVLNQEQLDGHINMVSNSFSKQRSPLR
ncbi:MAG: hypothetical protein UT39_C0002G0112 [Candidatus Woesebacteria bacterium GW2011_GWA1_39_21]|uniref:Uncharacterized protein n=1 Tax=Candidatus Woesebacteria bacterium GW2011_GWA1_39_21 TaxID=1618550 RepID=A0A0G0NGI1_9BACT|nr:MAG: hypothetical protein UT39_C0002G0112 [Candidatus Woesebacteria bacterium GW2011_GWA1_39_21]